MRSSPLFAGDLAGPLAVPARVARDIGNGPFARVFAALIKAREIQAQREVNRYLARQPDRLLRDIGLDETAIAELRWDNLA